MISFSQQLEQLGEFGVVEEVAYPIVIISGLPNAHPNELVIFENGEMGEVFLIERHNVTILLFSKNPVAVGEKVTRLGKPLSIPVGTEILGTVVDPLGLPLAQSTGFKSQPEERAIEVHPRGIMERERITQQLLTGVTVVDMMVPLGRGQKQLIIGDRKSGKTAFLLATIKSQVQRGAVAIYASIGHKRTDVKKIEEFFRKEKITASTVIVATTAYDSPGLIYLTPYTAMTIAEYFRDQGQDVLIIFDDLLTHAKAYREMSLLARRFPGRDSYPGDIFYIHARLLERTGNFKHPKTGAVSITSLPVVETVEGDITGYIATNLIGMTDGHIYYDSNLYYNGRRPAVNIPLSVTRVGRQTQTDLSRSINRELVAFLALYEKMQTFSHFGAELTNTVKGVLRAGDIIYQFFNQEYGAVIPLDVQLTLFGMVWLNYFTPEFFFVEDFRKRLIAASATPETKKMLEEMLKAETFNEFLSHVAKNKDSLLTICGVNETRRL